MLSFIGKYWHLLDIQRQHRNIESRAKHGFQGVVWWRRGELNPRPQALRHKVYMLISLF